MNIPKSTINFIAGNLWHKWILKKSFRWKTGYYEADPEQLQKTILWEYSKKEKILDEIVPKLQEKNKSHISRPKITFIDWLESCRQAYLELLKVKRFYEFWVHADLENAFWEKFMDDFICSRVKKWVFCDSVWTEWEVENRLFQKRILWRMR